MSRSDATPSEWATVGRPATSYVRSQAFCCGKSKSAQRFSQSYRGELAGRSLKSNLCV